MQPAAFEVVFESGGAGSAHPDLVAVAISLFDYARFLPMALDSIAAQRHVPIELIIVDDRSEGDDSLAVAKDWLAAHQRRFARTLLLRHRRNQGLARCRNTAFAQARAAHVFVMDADNEIYPRAIGRLLQAIRDSAAAAAYAQLEIFGARSGLGSADVWQTDWLRSGNYIDAMAMISARAFADAGGYSHIEGGWEDYDLWLKFVEQGYEAVFVPEILCRYRVHPGSMLRTETARSYDGMFVEMTMRHPWLRLAPIPAEMKLP